MKFQILPTLIVSICLLTSVTACAQDTQSPAALSEAKASKVNPEVFVAYLYNDESEEDYGELPMTPRLAELFQMDDDHIEIYDLPFGRMDFGWIVNGQDSLITDVDISSYDIPGRSFGDLRLKENDRKLVITKFKNFDTPTTINYYWEKLPNGWALDDATGSSDGETGWTLSLLLGYGF